MSTSKMQCVIYRSNDGWRWRLRANNGRIIAVSSEGYSSAEKAMAGSRLTDSLFRALRGKRRSLLASGTKR